MTKTKNPVRVTKVTITRAEGPHDECGKPVEVDSIDEANKILGRWSHTAPAAGGYDKCDFTIEFAGVEHAYTGRYDLKHGSVELPDLRTQLDYYTGIAVGIRAEHISPELFERMRKGMDPNTSKFLTQIRAAVLS